MMIWERVHTVVTVFLPAHSFVTKFCWAATIKFPGLFLDFGPFPDFSLTFAKFSDISRLLKIPKSVTLTRAWFWPVTIWPCDELTVYWLHGVKVRKVIWTGMEPITGRTRSAIWGPKIDSVSEKAKLNHALHIIDSKPLKSRKFCIIYAYWNSEYNHE